MDDQIRLRLQLLQFGDAATARGLMGELEAQCRQNAEAFEQDRITAAQFGAASKELNAAIRSVQSSLAQFDDAQDEAIEALGQQVAAQIAAAESAERLAQSERDAAAAAKSEGDYAELLASERRQAAEAAAEHAHAVELEAAAIAHQIETERHAAEQVANAQAAADQRAEEAARRNEEAQEQAAAAVRERAAADQEELEAARLYEQQERESAAAADRLTAADRELNAALRDDAAAEARSRLAALDAEARELAGAMARGDAITDEMVASLNRLESEASQARTQLKGLEAAAQAEAGAMDHAADAGRRAGTAAVHTAADLRVARQGALDVARGVQDFAQGGFGAILNNLEGLGRGIPALLKAPMALLTSLPTVLTLVGVALYQFGPMVYNAFRHFALGSHEIPKATDALGQIDGRLKEVTKRLDAYREAQKLTNGELADYNRLAAEQLLLEKAKAKATEEKAAREKTLTANPTKEDEEKERAKLFEQTMGTPELREQLTKSVQESLPQGDRARLLAIQQRTGAEARDRGDFTGDADWDAETSRIRRRAEEANKALKDFDASIRQQAEKLVDDSVTRGQRQATENIRGFMRRQPQRFSDYQQFAFGTPNATNPDGTPNAALTQEPLDAARRDKRSVEQQQRMAKLDKDLKAKQEKQQKADDAADKAMADLEDYVAGESAKESKAATQTVLKRDRSSGATDESAKRIAEFASRQLGLKEEALFDYVQAEMVKVLTGASAKAGVKTIDAKLIRDASRQAAGKALGRQEKAEERDEKKEEKEEAKDEKEATKARRKTVKDSGMEARAGALYAQARAHGATDDQATDLVGQKVLAYLNRQIGTRRGKPVYANAGMSQDQKALLAAQIASQGRHQVQDQTRALAGRNLTSTQKLVQVASGLNAEVAAMEERQRQLEQRIDSLGREVSARQRTGARR